MNTITDTTDISVCTDCILLLANGEVIDGHGVDETAEHANRMRAHLGDAEVVPGGDELGFSWADCEGCGSPLGGDRFTATIFHRD